MGEKVNQVGDVMHDAAIFYRNISQKPQNITISDSFILCTIHRAENTDDQKRLTNIISALNLIAREQQVVFPAQPRTRKILASGKYDFENITIVEPVGYL